MRMKADFLVEPLTVVAAACRPVLRRMEVPHPSKTIRAKTTVSTARLRAIQVTGRPPDQADQFPLTATVLVYRYWQGSVHFHGSKGSALVYAAHGCILLCAHQGMAARTLITQQKAVGHPGDNQLYCAVDRVLYDDVVIYNQ